MKKFNIWHNVPKYFDQIHIPDVLPNNTSSEMTKI